jgi:hypothetical protein
MALPSFKQGTSRAQTRRVTACLNVPSGTEAIWISVRNVNIGDIVLIVVVDLDHNFFYMSASMYPKIVKLN